MIELRFEPVQDTWDVETPEQADPASVEYGLFYCRILLRIDGVDLLGNKSGPGPATMPLIGFGPRVLQKLRLLQSGAKDQLTIDDSGWLYLHEHDGLVNVATSQFRKGMDAPHHEVMAAFERFNEEIKQTVSAQVPAMTRNPMWTYWFPD